MRRVLALGASLCLFSAADDAQAATFTPDMWIYEITFAAWHVAPSNVYAWSDAVPLGEAVPGGCSSSPPEADGTKRIDCHNPAIDLLATMDDPLKATYLTRVQTIGFNGSSVICDGPVIVGCPSGGRGTEPFVYSYTGSYWDVVLDANRGRLSFCGSMYMFSEACYDLGPTGGTAWAGVTSGMLTGTWDAVTGGRWMASGDPYFSYVGVGRLLSSPAETPVVVTPLPAPVLMLGSGLAAIAGLAVRDRRRRRLLA